MDRQTDELSEPWIDEQKDRRMVCQIYGCTGEQTDRWYVSSIDGLVDKQTDGMSDLWIYGGKTERQAYGLSYLWMDGWTERQMDRKTDGQTEI